MRKTKTWVEKLLELERYGENKTIIQTENIICKGKHFQVEFINIWKQFMPEDK